MCAYCEDHDRCPEDVLRKLVRMLAPPELRPVEEFRIALGIRGLRTVLPVGATMEGRLARVAKPPWVHIAAGRA